MIFGDTDPHRAYVVLAALFRSTDQAVLHVWLRKHTADVMDAIATAQAVKP